MSVKCRTCAETIFNPNAKNLFEQEDNEILLNIEILTGIRVTDEQHMPKHICTCCHLDLYHSIAFRERCLKSEQFLQNDKDKATTLDPLKTAEAEALPSNAAVGQPQCTKKIKRTGDITENTENAEMLKHQSTPRVLRARKRNSNTLAENSIQESKKSRSLSNSEDCQGTFTLKELTELSVSEETSDLQDAALEEASPSPSPAKSSPVGQPLTEQDNGTEIKKKDKPSSGAKVFICDLCGHQSSNPKNLDIHILRHKGEKNFECTECGTKHYSKYLLQLHIRVKHQGEMPFVCRFCGQRFYSGSTRQRHEQVRHIKSWAYECKICGKKYNTKSCLNKHEFLHSGMRPYRCDLCNVAFPRKPGLRIHCRTKQHQKRANEALNKQLGDIKEITVAEEAIVFPDSLIVELDV